MKSFKLMLLSIGTLLASSNFIHAEDIALPANIVSAAKGLDTAELKKAAEDAQKMVDILKKTDLSKLGDIAKDIKDLSRVASDTEDPLKWGEAIKSVKDIASKLAEGAPKVLENSEELATTGLDGVKSLIKIIDPLLQLLAGILVQSGQSDLVNIGQELLSIRNNNLAGVLGKITG